jgi:hypothetical protein
MRLVEEDEDEEDWQISVPAGAATLLSGGAAGAEAAFGACAEQWGVTEINYSFEGHKCHRTRGVVMLSDLDLAKGSVSVSYVQAHMHRTYHTPLFEKLFQSIWHQVNTARQVFVIGRIQEDQTVKGGTGWAAELGKRLRKDVLVFDQERNIWLQWTPDGWAERTNPKITSHRFTGTGTRFLNDHGKAAIEALFERSFGS